MNAFIRKSAVKALRALNWLSKHLLKVNFIRLRLQRSLEEYLNIGQEQELLEALAMEDPQAEEEAVLNFVRITVSLITSDQE